MTYQNLTKFFKSILIASSLLLFPLSSFAQAGCCSHHGGTAGCNTSTGHQKCKDGSDSPSCACNGGAVPTKNSYQSRSYKNSTSTTTKKQKTINAKNTNKNTTTTPTTTTNAKTTKGCCARHGGVARCNTTTGYQICKDGTQSSTCKC